MRPAPIGRHRERNGNVLNAAGLILSAAGVVPNAAGVILSAAKDPSCLFGPAFVFRVDDNRREAT
jgi:hypothetical protein